MEFNLSAVVDLINGVGFREYAYLDSAGIWTYGFGFTQTPTGNKVGQFDRISKDKSIAFIKTIILQNYLQLQHLVKVPLNEYQWALHS